MLGMCGVECCGLSRMVLRRVFFCLIGGCVVVLIWRALRLDVGDVDFCLRLKRASTCSVLHGDASG